MTLGQIIALARVCQPITDDGSAAHEPVEGIGILVSPGNAPIDASGGRLLDPVFAAQAEQIGALICERDQLQREIVETRAHLGDVQTTRTDLLVENSRLRALLSRVEETASTDPVKADIERTIDHLLNGRTTKDQRKGLNTATERADRVRPGDDAAVGRALR